MNSSEFDFGSAIRDVNSGLILKPLLHNYLYDAKFPDFSIHFKNYEMERAADSWFHPSTHPLWRARQLYHYLAQPELLIPEKKEYMGTMAVTVGKAMHGFMGSCLTDLGILPRELQRCYVCPEGGGCRAPGEIEEPGVIDQEAGSRGHMDGILDLANIHHVEDDKKFPVFEFKTSNERSLAKLVDMDLDAYRAKAPGYYAQNQEYMRMSGRRWVIVIYLTMGYPWRIVEIHVPYNHAYAMNVRNKYLMVRQAVADQRPPIDCCGNARNCMVGNSCRGGLGR